MQAPLIKRRLQTALNKRRLQAALVTAAYTRRLLKGRLQAKLMGRFWAPLASGACQRRSQAALEGVPLARGARLMRARWQPRPLVQMPPSERRLQAALIERRWQAALNNPYIVMGILRPSATIPVNV